MFKAGTRVCLFTFIGFSVVLAPRFATADTATEAAVREFFANTPVMIEIARCESKFRQFNDDGAVLRGGWDQAMVGVFQIYETVHRAAATALGYDLTTLPGNLGYAQHLYETQGTTPWNSAKACWENATLTAASPDLINEEETKRALLGQIVMLLQRLIAEKRAA